MIGYQPMLPIETEQQVATHTIKNYREELIALLAGDFDFHNEASDYATHNFHSFPAKFPPQLPHKIIHALTYPGQVVLDPMSGSGTTVVEAFLADRRSIGFDIDPLALRLVKAKVTPLDAGQIAEAATCILQRARQKMKQSDRQKYLVQFCQQVDEGTQSFIDYWFSAETQVELAVLLQEIRQIEQDDLRVFFELAFSSIIITKSGGVSLAFDLAHTRPHRAKVIKSPAGKVIWQADNLADISDRRVAVLTKTLRSPLVEFEKRLEQNIAGLVQARQGQYRPLITGGNAQTIPLPADSIDLIVTSPPYASNAIDYMRAHKFSLAWLGYAIDDLGQLRKEYIGGEALSDFAFTEIPSFSQNIVRQVSAKDEKKGRVLHRYYSEMRRTLQEMYRVLKPGKAAIVVVGSSTLRGVDTQTHNCLADIGQAVGFEVPKIGVRHLDRNRRMMPAGMKVNHDSQIQQRMHEEYLIGFYKPNATTE
jgi:DNA modification methylase